MESTSPHRNRLADETSPYLRQHAANPVDWYPWGPEALERARREDKPILLSIGYAACHWCHVMAHESFEDEETARLLNEHFVCIKVDREERPDLDHIYQLAHQLLTRRPGGWPLTIFLAPDGKPFFGGTYFPKDPRYGMPGFPDVLHAMDDLWRNRRAGADDLGRRLTDTLARLDAAAQGDDRLDDEPLADARRALGLAFDPVHGGTRGAPKFPQPTQLDFLLRWSAAHPDDVEARTMPAFTLERMAKGGLHDQLGGGFFRYSTDERWLIPHFEKMLYDNALLLRTYADGYRASGNELFRKTALDTAEWALRELRTPEGAFASSLDADTEGEEGATYVWTYDEVRTLLTPQELRVAELVFDLSRSGNFEGRNHLWAAASAADAAKHLDLPVDEARRLLDAARDKLRAARGMRPQPGRDDKVLTSWNALLIGALARAGRLLDRPDLVEAASAAADFLRRELWRDGRLLAAWREGHARFNAYLDDHAFLLDALLELLEARWREADLDWATALADLLLERFPDRTAGGFFFTSDDHERLIHRSKSASDDALPSGNGVAARALLRLGALLGRTVYIDAAERTLHAFLPAARETPHAFTTLLGALDELLHPPRTAVLRGSPQALAPWRRIAAVRGPRDAAFVIPAGEHLPEELAVRSARNGAVAYVCEGVRCSSPFTDLEAFRAAWSSP